MNWAWYVSIVCLVLSALFGYMGNHINDIKKQNEIKYVNSNIMGDNILKNSTLNSSTLYQVQGDLNVDTRKILFSNDEKLKLIDKLKSNGASDVFVNIYGIRENVENINDQIKEIFSSAGWSYNEQSIYNGSLNGIIFIVKNKNNLSKEAQFVYDLLNNTGFNLRILEDINEFQLNIPDNKDYKIGIGEIK